MPITLVTGTPGAGKTLFVVRMLMEDLLPTGRPVFTNIDGFTAPGFANLHLCGHEGPTTWLSFPDGAICVFDEVQRQYPFKNGMAKTPDYIAGYETHRHRGMDFIFITQGPYLIDRHLHPLIDRHFHIYRPFGFKRSSVLEWQGVNEKPQPLQSRTNAAVKNFTFPKKYFANYKSATVHTVKARPPWKLFATLAGIAAVTLFAGWKVLDGLTSNLFTSDGSTVEAAAARNMGEHAGELPAFEAPCALVQSVTQTSVTTRISGQRYVLRRGDVVIRDGVLTVGGQEALAWPLCRATM